MATKKSIGRTLAHIDVAANTSVRIHKDFFNSHATTLFGICGAKEMKHRAAY
jgi:hypothetical protein